MPDLSKITCIEDLRVIAQRRVPRMFYDYADSGSYTEGTYRANESDFQRIKLRQRVAVNMEGRSTRTTMVGLQAPWGTLRLGRITTPNFISTIRLNPFGDSTTFNPITLHTYVGGQPLDAAPGAFP